MTPLYHHRLFKYPVLKSSQVLISWGLGRQLMDLRCVCVGTQYSLYQKTSKPQVELVEHHSDPQPFMHHK
jgi:hypothetical protein